MKEEKAALHVNEESQQLGGSPSKIDYQVIISKFYVVVISFFSEV